MFIHSRRLRLSPLALACSAMLLAHATAIAQPEQGESPTQSGTLQEVQTKGRISTLVIQTDAGESYEVKVTPQLNFAVTAPGDEGFVAPGVFISGRGPLTQEKVFLNDVSVYLFPPGRRPPAGRIQKADPKDGESLAVYQVAGEVAAAGPAEGYPEYTDLNLKVGGRVPDVWLEKDYKVQVYSADPAHAAAGAKVEVLMKPLRGGKFLPVGVKVLREEPFQSAELLGASDKTQNN
jgi:hypothetical protein